MRNTNFICAIFLILILLVGCPVLMTTLLKNKTKKETTKLLNWEHIPDCTFCGAKKQPDYLTEEEEIKSFRIIRLEQIKPENKNNCYFWCSNCQKIYLVEKKYK